jgi:hypothetical protein
MAFGGAKPPSVLEAPGAIIGCGVEGVLLRDGPTSQTLTLCDDSCRAIDLPQGASELVPAVVDGKLAALSVHGGVLALWREGMAIQYFGVPGAVHWIALDRPVMALSDGKVVDVVARDDKTYVVVRIALAGA